MKVSEVPSDLVLYLEFVKGRNALSPHEILNMCYNVVGRDKNVDGRRIGVFVTKNRTLPELLSYQVARIGEDVVDKDIYEIYDYGDLETTIFLPMSHFEKSKH